MSRILQIVDLCLSCSPRPNLHLQEGGYALPGSDFETCVTHAENVELDESATGLPFVQPGRVGFGVSGQEGTNDRSAGVVNAAVRGRKPRARIDS